MIETLGSLALAAGHDIRATTPRSLADGSMPWTYPNLENPAVPISAAMIDPPSAMYPQYPASAGTRFTAIWAAIRILSGIVARIECRPMRTPDNGDSWEEERTHYLTPLLTQRWNPAMTAYRAKRLMQVWVLTHGNAYALIDYSTVNGRVRQLIPMRPDRIQIEEGRYFYTGGDSVTSFSAAQVLHIRGLEFDGIKGISPLEHFRRTIGTALAQEDHQSAFYRNGARPGGVLKHPAQLTHEEKIKIAQDWNAQYGGAANSHRLAILDEAMTYEPIVMSMVDAEFIASRQFSIADVSRIYGVPLHMLAELSRSTNNNIEHQGLEVERFSAADHFSAWEAELNDALLSSDEQRSIRIAFDREALHQPDMESRMNTARLGIQGGVIKPNEGRRWFGLQPVEGGDRLYMQQQMVELGKDTHTNEQGNQVPPVS